VSARRARLHAFPDVHWRAALCGVDALPEGDAVAPYNPDHPEATTCVGCRRTAALLTKIEALARRLPDDDVRTVTRAVTGGAFPDTERAARDLHAVLAICARGRRP
jgi:hypothetical protein